MICALVLLASLQPEATAEPPSTLVEVRIQAWFAGIDKGTVEGDTESMDGTKLDADGDLGLGKVDGGLAPEISVLAATGDGLFRAWLTLGRLEFKARRRLPRTFVFEGRTYPAGSAAESEIDIDYVILGADWTFFLVPGGSSPAHYGQVTLEGGLEGFAARTEIVTATEDEGETNYGIFPWAGLRAGYRLGPVSASVFGRLGPMMTLGAAIDFDFAHLVISGGWRWINFRGHDLEPDESERFDLDVSGPFLSVEIYP